VLQVSSSSFYKDFQLKYGDQAASPGYRVINANLIDIMLLNDTSCADLLHDIRVNVVWKVGIEPVSMQSARFFH
jgi:hypothetical protein